MNKKQVTITFGTSVHYFKSNVSVTFDKDVKEVNENFDELNKEVTNLYFKVLAQELALTKKFNDMDLKEIKKFLKKQLNTK